MEKLIKQEGINDKEPASISDNIFNLTSGNKINEDG
jgi:hypothetical protein